eukprot:scaffold117691_cov77-Phaeocystis_antarctica.AAC.4
MESTARFCSDPLCGSVEVALKKAPHTPTSSCPVVSQLNSEPYGASISFQGTWPGFVPTSVRLRIMPSASSA